MPWTPCWLLRARLFVTQPMDDIDQRFEQWNWDQLLDEIQRLRKAITMVLGDPDLPPLAAQTLTEALGSVCDTKAPDAE